jgi:hypothetical protein
MATIDTVDVAGTSSRGGEVMGRVAVIGDVGGYVAHLRHALGQLGVTDSVWPDDLHVIQVGDLFGGRADVEVAELVAPHLQAGRWTQLIGNWELEAVGGVAIGRAGRTVHPGAVAEFRRWHRDGYVRRAASVTSSSGVVGVVTHAGISRGFWKNDLRSEPDARLVVERLNTMRLDDVARPGSMFGRPDEPAPGPIWSSEAETWRDWVECPFPQVHGHTTAWRQGLGWSDFLPEEMQDRAKVDRGHVIFTPSPGSRPIIGIDPGLWDRSVAGALRPLIFRDASEMA